MKKLLQVHFPYNGPFGEEMTQSARALAESINNEPGFIWKIWTENKQTQEAGGIYLFESEETALSYLKMHTVRLKEMGVTEVFGKIFDVNEPLTQIDKGNLLPYGE